MTQYPTQDVRLQVYLLIEKVKKHQQASGFCPHDEYISMGTLGGLLLCFMVCGVSVLFSEVILI